MMHFRAVLFLLVVAAGCGDRKSNEPAVVAPLPAQEVLSDASIAEVVAPKSVEPSSSIAKPVEKSKVDVLDVAVLPGKFGECMKLGKELAAKGEHAKARELFEAAIALDKKQPSAYVELARSYIATKDKALAIANAKKAVKLAPGSSLAYNTLGRAELLRHDYDAAIAAFTQATDLDASNVWAWNNLGLVYLTIEAYEDAIDALVQATSHKGTTGYMWNNLGLAYEQLDQLDEARVAFEMGGKLGSAEAKASRKRLEGVKSIAIAKPKPIEMQPEVKSFELREPEPEPAAPVPVPVPESESESESDGDKPAAKPEA